MSGERRSQETRACGADLDGIFQCEHVATHRQSGGNYRRGIERGMAAVALRDGGPA